MKAPLNTTTKNDCYKITFSGEHKDQKLTDVQSILRRKPKGNSKWPIGTIVEKTFEEKLVTGKVTEYDGPMYIIEYDDKQTETLPEYSVTDIRKKMLTGSQMALL